MGFLDKIGGALQGVLNQAQTAAPGMIASALAGSKFGDLQGLVGQLQQGGLDQQVKSWLGSGANLPVTNEQIRAALGNEQVRHLAEQFGLPVDQTLNFLSEHLPTVVDQASPNGTLASN
jgi:uncharacterized protein YidB (DUF937 family)